MATKAAAVPAVDGDILVSNCMKMSYSTNGIMSYGESYQFELSTSEREAALAAAGDDPMAEIPPALNISASFDTQDGGAPILEQGKKYHVTITPVEA